MSPYAEELAHARVEALRQLIDAMREAEDPAEKRRCAVAIFNAPDPCDLDDEIELEEENEGEEEAEDADQTEDDSDEDEDSEEEADSESAEGTPNSPHPRSAPTSDITHPTSDLPTDIIAKAKALLDSGAFDHLAAPP
jgi:hypothetical protein